MRRLLFSSPIAPLALAPIALAIGVQPAQAAPGGLLRTLLKGYWICESSGDAVAPPTMYPQDSFRVIADSSYRTTAGLTGTYLLTGNDLTMTTGPFRGRKYILVGQGILHPIGANGTRTTDRCVRQSGANTLQDSEAADESVGAD
jgi:hypothetical protein